MYQAPGVIEKRKPCFLHVLKQKSDIIKERVQVLRHLSHMLGGVCRRLPSGGGSSGNGVFLRPLWSVLLSLYVLAFS